MSSTISLRSNARSGSNHASGLRSYLTKSFGAAGLIVGALVGFVALQVVGLVLLGLLGAVAGAFAGSALATSFSRRALQIVRSSVEATEVGPSDEPRLFNLLESLAAVAGVPMPRVSVVAAASMNVMTLVDPAGGAEAEIVVTADLTQRLSRIALEGVVATSMARIKSGQLEGQVEAAALSIERPWFVPKTLRERMVAAASGGVDVFDIDVRACAYTRFPPGLAEAYETMNVATTVTSAAPAACDSLWIASPRAASPGASAGGRIDASERVAGSTVEQRGDEVVTLVERIALLREI